MAHRTEWEVSGDKTATRGIQDPLGHKGDLGRGTEGTSWVTPESQSPEASGKEGLERFKEGPRK